MNVAEPLLSAGADGSTVVAVVRSTVTVYVRPTSSGRGGSIVEAPSGAIPYSTGGPNCPALSVTPQLLGNRSTASVGASTKMRLRVHCGVQLIDGCLPVETATVNGPSHGRSVTSGAVLLPQATVEQTRIPATNRVLENDSVVIWHLTLSRSGSADVGAPLCR